MVWSVSDYDMAIGQNAVSEYEIIVGLFRDQVARNYDWAMTESTYACNGSNVLLCQMFGTVTMTGL